MPQQLLIRGGQPGAPQAVPIECGANGATVSNSGPWPVYYRDELPVSAFVNDGSVASGASVTLYGAQYFVVDRGDFASPVDTAALFVLEAAAAAVSTGGGSSLAPTAVKTSAYTAAASDLVPVNATGGAVTVTLPAAPADKAQVVVKKIDATANVVTVARGGSDVFNKAGGSTSLTLLLANQSIALQYSAAGGIWYVTSSDTPVGPLDARYPAAYGLAIGRGGCVVPVGIRAHAAFDNPIAIATGATGGITFEQFYPLTDATATTVLPVFGNWMAQNGWSNGDYDATQAIRISAAVKNSDSTIVPFQFNGSHTVTLTPQTTPFAVPDMPLAFDKQVSANDKFGNPIALTGAWLRIRVDPIDTTRQDSVTTTSGSATVTDASIVAGDAGKLVTGTGFPSNTYVGTVTAGTSFTLVNAPGSSVAVNATASGTVTATITATIPSNTGNYGNNDTLTTQNATDLTVPGSGTVSGGSGSNFYGPIVLLGRAKTRKPIVALISDSILDGYQDDFHSPYFGPVLRACVALGFPCVKLSRGGETSLAWTTAIGRRYRTALLDGCTHAIVSLGTNDGALTSGAGAGGVTTMQTRLTSTGTLLSGLGIKPYIASVPPRTTSTDSWATTANQTAVSGSQITFLASLNQWIRAVPSPYLGVLDLEGLVSSAQDSGKWAAAATTDGVHPSDTISRGTLTTACQTLMSGWSVS